MLEKHVCHIWFLPKNVFLLRNQEVRLVSSWLQQNYNKSQASLSRKRQINLNRAWRCLGAKREKLKREESSVISAQNMLEEVIKNCESMASRVDSFDFEIECKEENATTAENLAEIFFQQEMEKNRPAAKSKIFNSKTLQKLGIIRDTTQERGTWSGTSRKR